MSLKPNEIQIYSNWRPVLPAGKYKLSVGQELGPISADGIENLCQDFIIDAPRFAIDPAEVYSVYPPANGRGNFEDNLPMITLKNKMLPWMRPLHDVNTWMTLLLFEQGELADDAITNSTVGQVIKPQDASVFAPNIIVNEEDESSPCLCLKVSLDLFQAIAPRKEEISLLAHVRAVSTANKELMGDDDDGFFSVVVGNRLVQDGKSYVACLVSVEGVENWPVVAGPVPAPANGSVHLFLLVSWKFTSEGEGDFKSLMENVNRNGVAMLGNSIGKLLDGDPGYLAFPYLTSIGETSSAWYRGPLTPCPLSPVESGICFGTDQARLIDPNSTMENLSYAAAFELGRLLALSDEHFALELALWRHGQYQQDENDIHGQIFRQNVPKEMAALYIDALHQFEWRTLVDSQMMTSFQSGMQQAPVATISGSWFNSAAEQNTAGMHVMKTLAGPTVPASPLESDFTKLSQHADEEFGDLAQARDSLMRKTALGGEQ
jgi:hypothetical protein